MNIFCIKHREDTIINSLTTKYFVFELFVVSKFCVFRVTQSVSILVWNRIPRILDSFLIIDKDVIISFNLHFLAFPF